MDFTPSNSPEHLPAIDISIARSILTLQDEESKALPTEIVDEMLQKFMNRDWGIISDGLLENNDNFWNGPEWRAKRHVLFGRYMVGNESFELNAGTEEGIITKMEIKIHKEGELVTAMKKYYANKLPEQVPDSGNPAIAADKKEKGEQK